MIRSIYANFLKPHPILSAPLGITALCAVTVLVARRFLANVYYVNPSQSLLQVRNSVIIMDERYRLLTKHNIPVRLYRAALNYLNIKTYKQMLKEHRTQVKSFVNGVDGWGIQVGRTSEYVVKAKPYLGSKATLDEADTTFFTLLDKDNKRLGGIHVRMIDVDDTAAHVTELSKPYMYVSGMFKYDAMEKNEPSDRPVSRALIQIVMEIFQRSNENSLLITTGHDFAVVLLAADFNVTQQHEVHGRQAKEDLVKSNFIKVIEFPVYNDYGSFNLEMRRYPEELFNGTHFRTKESVGRLQSAHVRYANNSVWEDIIDGQPILSGDGPVLPKWHIPTK